MDDLEQGRDLREYAFVVWRQRWIVIGTTVLLAVVALVSALLETPLYQAVADVAIEPRGTTFGGAGFEQNELETQVRIVSSVAVAEIVKESLGLAAPASALTSRASATLIEDTTVLRIRSVDTDPQGAQQLAQGFAQGYLEHRRQESLRRLVEASSGLRALNAELRSRIDEIDLQLTGAGDTEREVLQRERSGLVERIGSNSAQLAFFETTDEVIRGPGSIIGDAVVPVKPFAPDPVRKTVLAVVLGLVLGGALAFVRDWVDDGILSESDLSRAAGGVPLLGFVPKWQEGEASRLPIVLAPGSGPAEAFRTLRTNLRFIAGRQPFKSVLVTSTGEGDGKSTVAANVAVAAARAGYSVILVDGDMRRPTVHKIFGLSERAGLSTALTGQVYVEEALHDVGEPNLRVLPAGPSPPNPAELLGSEYMGELISVLDGWADMVIYDGPPLLGLADALELGPRVDATVLVVDAGSTRRRHLRSATERLQQIGARVVGTVLNRVDTEGAYYRYYYYYKYAYGEATNGQRPIPVPTPAGVASASKSPTQR